MKKYRQQAGSPFSLILVFLLILMLLYLFLTPEKTADTEENLRPVVLQETQEDIDISLSEKPDVETEEGLSGSAKLTLLVMAAALGLTGGGVLLYFSGNQKRRGRYGHAHSAHGEGGNVIKMREARGIRIPLRLRLPRKLRLKLRRRRHHSHQTHG